MIRTVEVDLNDWDENHRMVARGVLKKGQLVRMLESKTGEYWYGKVELYKFGFSYIRPLHRHPFIAWDDSEADQFIE